MVVLESTVLDGFKFITLSALSNVSIIISNHLVEECLGLVGGSFLVALVLHDRDNIHALLIKFSLDLLFVSGESL